MNENVETMSKKERAIKNNTNNVRNAAAVASKVDHPVAKAIGEGVLLADKLTDGKASEKLGKSLYYANKLQPGGRRQQKQLNRLNESGLGDKIGDAARKMDSIPGGTNSNKMPNDGSNNSTNKTPKGTLSGSNIGDDTSKRETQDEASDGGDASFKVTFKILKYGLIACACCFPIIIFCCLFISASQVQLKSTGLGNADALNAEDAEEKINKKLDEDEEDLEEEATEEEVESEEEAYNFYINEDSEKLKEIKLKESNLILTAKVKRRKYNEADLNELKDFYPEVSSLSEEYDEDLVYDFFFKMYNIFITYRDEYNVYLDLPLLMSTLMVESDDMNKVFSSNLTDEEKAKKALSKDRIKDLYSYDTDLSSYYLSPNSSEHDMELLAQNMVSATSGDEADSCENTLVDGVCYQVDEKQYKEFLKEFLERKYFVKDEGPEGSGCPTETPFEKYELTKEQIEEIATLIYDDKLSNKEISLKLSFIANLYELSEEKKEDDSSGIYEFIKNHDLLKSSELTENLKSRPEKVIEIVKSVLLEGKRTLPGYIDKLESLANIKSAKNEEDEEDKSISVNKIDLYEKHTTKLTTVDDIEYTYYLLFGDNKDILGYTDEEKRDEIGDYYYDYVSGKLKECKSLSDGNYVGGVEFMTGGVGKIFYYNQTDYPNSPYGSYGSIASHGCGPTSLSIAISSLLKEAHDPIELTKHVCDRGGCTNGGTAWANIESTPKDYGLKAVRTGDKQAIVNALAKGNSIVIAIMCPGHFTSGGHFITLTAVKNNGKVTVADPASRDRSTDWDFNIVLEETCSNDGFWIVSK